MENITPPPKKKRGRKPKNNITINENPVFNNTLDTSLVIKLDNLVEEENKEDDINNLVGDIEKNDEEIETKKTSEVCWNCCHGLVVMIFLFYE